jgi:hypothetical protein
MWGDTHNSKFVMERHTSIFKTGDTLQNLNWREALQYLSGETHTSTFTMGRHILQSLKWEGTRSKF